MKRHSLLLLIIAFVASLVVLGWVVGMRLKNLPSTVPLGTNSTGKQTDLPPGSLPVLADSMPPFTGITKWLNSDPLTPEKLRGKVVLVDFWTYSCINCIRTLPYVTSWDQKYRADGLVIIGVHTPEFDFEKVEDNVSKAIAQDGIKYPVAMDNDYGTWNAYGNQYWPAEYLFDAQGRLRETNFGEGEYDQTEKNIQALLSEAGKPITGSLTTVTTPTDLSKVETPETYVGYERQEFLGSPEPVKRDAVQTYSVPSQPEFNKFYFGGKWNVGSQRAVPAEAGAKIVYPFHASNANLVMGMGTSGSVKAEVLLDGKPVPPQLRGLDVTEEGGKTFVTITDDRLYNLIDAKGDYQTRQLEIIFSAPGVEVYAFTFG